METIMVNARDGISLACHQYLTPQPNARVFCLHGSSFNARRYNAFAKKCQQVGFEVIVCDLRGHGQSEGEPGTCKYVGQLEDDFYDILNWFSNNSQLPTIVGGHSAGAAIVLRYIEKYGQDDISGCYFISPALGSFQEAVRYDGKSSKLNFFMKFWRKKTTFSPAPQAAQKHAPRINNRLFWLAYLLPFLRSLVVLKFPAVKKIAELEGRVLNYSFNLACAVSLNSYVKTFRQLKTPCLFVCGEKDELLHPEFLPTIEHWHLAPTLDKEVHMLPGVNHMSVINASSEFLIKWLAQRWKKAGEKAA